MPAAIVRSGAAESGLQPAAMILTCAVMFQRLPRPEPAPDATPKGLHVD